MEVGIIGLPYVGKTTLFTALTGVAVPPGAGMRPNIGMVNIPDDNLRVISERIETEKQVAATMKLVDIVGLAPGATSDGTAAKFLQHIQQVDALIHVVRCFESGDVAHVSGSLDPGRDIDAVESELILSDLQVVESALPKTQKAARGGKDPEAPARLAVLEQVAPVLEDGRPARVVELDDPDQNKALRGLGFLSTKRVLYVANVGDDDVRGEGALARLVRDHAKQQGMQAVAVCAQVDKELSELDETERAEMLEPMGLEEPAVNLMARGAYALLGLQSFYTAGPKEVRAWPIRSGATAKAAAGSIHSDLERGFIRAEIYSIADLVEHGSEKAIKDAGKLRVEGKDYVMQAEDVAHILFNV